MDDVITLISTAKSQNDFGVWEETPTKRDVFCKVQSISRTEFYEAGRNGLNPSFVFTVFSGDYNGEVLCEYHGQQYAVYRTYIFNGDTRTSISNTKSGSSVRTYGVPGEDYVDLYVERKGGTNGETGAG